MTNTDPTTTPRQVQVVRGEYTESLSGYGVGYAYGRRTRKTWFVQFVGSSLRPKGLAPYGYKTKTEATTAAQAMGLEVVK